MRLVYLGIKFCTDIMGRRTYSCTREIQQVRHHLWCLTCWMDDILGQDPKINWVMLLEQRGGISDIFRRISWTAKFMLKYLLKLDLGNEDKVREGEQCFDRARNGNEEPNVELPDWKQENLKGKRVNWPGCSGAKVWPVKLQWHNEKSFKRSFNYLFGSSECHSTIFSSFDHKWGRE